MDEIDDAGIPPGPPEPRDAALAGALACAVEQLELLARVRAEQEALEQRVLATVYRASIALHAQGRDALSDDALDLAIRSAAVEAAAATRSSPRTMASRLHEAGELVDRFPQLVDALAEGRITPRHLRVLREQGARLDTDAQRAEYCRRMLPVAESQAHTRLESRAKATVEHLLGLTAADRAACARATRRIVIDHLDDGMSDLHVTLPTYQATAILDRLTQSAKAITRAASGAGMREPRSYDQLRVDVLADLLLTAEPTADAHAPATGVRASVTVTVPVLTLMGLDHAPATLNGAPIPIEDARRLAGEANSWVRLLTHPATGQPLAVDTYQPSTALRNFVTGRDQHCRIPGCRQAARRCDTDHATPWSEGGRTSPDNLYAVCRGHHTMRHWAKWRIEPKLDTGELDWISPSGRRYPDIPEPVGPTFTPATVPRVRERAPANPDPHEPAPF